MIMNISPISYQPNIKKSKPSFGQIRPEHLFINSQGFRKNMDWANFSIGIIKQSKKKISKGEGFDKLIHFISSTYNTFYNGSNDFGKIRKCVCGTFMTEKYDSYTERMRNILDNEKTQMCLQSIASVGYLSFAKTHTMNTVLKHSNKNVELNSILLLIEDAILYNQKAQNPLIRQNESKLVISSPESKVIEPVFEEVGLIYKNILNKKMKPNQHSIDELAKEVAQIHWLISQVRPYYRGSAGIADILAKSIFEAKGVQVSAYKKDVNPNLEAFVMPLDKYSEEYKNFFSKPLRPIKLMDKIAEAFS